VRELPETLKREKFVIDRKKHQATRARVKVTIERELDQVLLQVCGRAEFARTCSRLFVHVVQQY
jgi:hypothetical protein